MDKAVSLFHKYTASDCHATAALALGLLGLGFASSYAFKFTRLIVSLMLPGIPLSRFGANKGAWAVVTGATAGIGEEFAKQLAAKGFNILAVSRDPAKLGKIAGEIETQSPSIKIKTHAIDFANASEADYDALQKTLDQLDIGVLINNVGKSHDHPDYFAEISDEEIEDILEINIASVVRVTKMVVPSLIEKRRGLILNIGSFASLVYSPLLAVYSGSKAFLWTWTNALGSELEESGITVRLVHAYFITSALSKIRKSSWMVPTPKQYVSAVLSRIGSRGGAIASPPYVSTPYLSHAIIHWLVDHFGKWSIWINFTKKNHKVIRKIWQKKQAKKQ